MVSSSIWCWTIYVGIPFRSLYVQANTSLNSFKSLINWSVITNLSAKFSFTCCTFSLVPKLTLVNYSSSIIVQLAMVRSYTRSRACVSSIIISPTFAWKKVSSKWYLTMLGGIANFTTNKSIDLTSCFRTSFIVTIFSTQSIIGMGSLWIGIVMVPIENMSNFVANITSSLSLNIP